jgi:hypothetical protein
MLAAVINLSHSTSPRDVRIRFQDMIHDTPQLGIEVSIASIHYLSHSKYVWKQPVRAAAHHFCTEDSFPKCRNPVIEAELNQIRQGHQDLISTFPMSLQKFLILLFHSIFSSRPCSLVMRSWANHWCLLHGCSSFLVGLDALDSTLEDLQSEDDGAATPKDPAESGEDSIGSCSGAN